MKSAYNILYLQLISQDMSKKSYLLRFIEFTWDALHGVEIHMDYLIMNQDK